MGLWRLLGGAARRVGLDCLRCLLLFLFCLLLQQPLPLLLIFCLLLQQLLPLPLLLFCLLLQHPLPLLLLLLLLFCLLLQHPLPLLFLLLLFCLLLQQPLPLHFRFLAHPQTLALVFPCTLPLQRLLWRPLLNAANHLICTAALHLIRITTAEL